MKCQHCGIHFDDGERECPLCGARAGRKGRMNESRRAVPAQSPRRRTKKPNTALSWKDLLTVFLVLLVVLFLAFAVRRFIWALLHCLFIQLMD